MAKWLLPLALGILVVAPFPRTAGEIARETNDSTIRLLFVGDLFFDRTIRTAMQEHGDDYPLSCVADRLAGYDLVVGNLEGPITPFASVSEGSEVGSLENYTFTFPTGTAEALARANIRLVNIGNNHIGNFGKEGVAMTIRYLDEAGVYYFGSMGEISTIYRTHFGSHAFSFIGHNEFGGLSLASTTELVREEADAGRIVFVYAHWGEEYVPPPPRVRVAAHAFIDAGAAAVFGSHPHVVLEREIYRGRPIYYSLGDFLFDQYWSDEVSRGLAVEARIREGGALALRNLRAYMKRSGAVCFGDIPGVP